MNTKPASGRRAGASCPLQNQMTEAAVSFPPFLPSNRLQGRNILPLPRPWSFFPGLSPHSWTSTLPNEVRKTQAAAWEGRAGCCSIHTHRHTHTPPTATFSLAFSPLFSHLSLSFPHFPPLAQQLILSAAASCSEPPWLDGWLALKPGHTAGCLGQASARKARKERLAACHLPLPTSSRQALWTGRLPHCHRREEKGGERLFPSTAEPR